MADWVELPQLVKRGTRFRGPAKGWRIVNQNQTLAFKATLVSTFAGSAKEQYVTFRVVKRKDNDEK